MIAIVNNTAPKKALKKLAEFAEIIEFNTQGITYNAISGHVDVFMCQISDNSLIVAPNTPDSYIKYLTEKGVCLEKGSYNVGNKYPQSVHYNAVATKGLLIHNLNISDSVILEKCSNKNHIHVNQAYTRCNLLPLTEDVFITSDKGIEKTLLDNHIRAHYLDPEGISLTGFPNGFIGGCIGIFEKQIFLVGSLKKYLDGMKLEKLFNDYSYEIIELYDGPLVDVGSIFIINEQ